MQINYTTELESPATVPRLRRVWEVDPCFTAEAICKWDVSSTMPHHGKKRQKKICWRVKQGCCCLIWKLFGFVLLEYHSKTVKRCVCLKRTLLFLYHCPTAQCEGQFSFSRDSCWIHYTKMNKIKGMFKAGNQIKSESSRLIGKHKIYPSLADRVRFWHPAGAGLPWWNSEVWVKSAPERRPHVCKELPSVSFLCCTRPN